MNEVQEHAKAQLAAALQRAMDAGVCQVIRCSVVRTMACGNQTTVQCIVMAESDEVARCIEERIASPTFKELLGDHSGRTQAGRELGRELNLNRLSGGHSAQADMTDASPASRPS